MDRLLDVPGIEKKPAPSISANVNEDGDFDDDETQLPQPDDETDAATGEGAGATSEITGGETVGTVGARYHLSETTTLSLGVSRDNNQAWVISPGLSLKF